MLVESPSATNEDSAWATFSTPLGAPELIAFCRDIERLFRINPFLEFKGWRQSQEDVYSFQGRNLSYPTPKEFDVKFRVEILPDGACVQYLTGFKTSTTFKVESDSKGSKLTIIDDYSGIPEEERKTRLDEVDRSLVTWAKYLQEYIVNWQRWSWLAPWRWYMRRIWQPMKPSARRITYMLIWVSFAELLGFILVFAIIWWDLF
jgi:hypothetical protein